MSGTAIVIFLFPTQAPRDAQHPPRTTLCRCSSCGGPGFQSPQAIELGSSMAVQSGRPLRYECAACEKKTAPLKAPTRLIVHMPPRGGSR